MPRARQLVAVVRRQHHLSEEPRADAGGGGHAGVAAAGRDRRAVPGAAAPPRQAQRPRQRRADGAGDRCAAPGRVRRARTHGRRRGCRRVRLVSARSARQREFGQNFLVDRNILDVIERLAGPQPDDIVLEVGGGPGILSERLAARAGFVHVVELDERLRERLTAAVADASNVALHFADALDIDLAALAPPPGKMVANLPYGVAATVILRSIDELPSLTQWVVMVQREVGERFAAASGSAAYGIPSVLAQLACEVKVLRPVSRQVFRPVPNVDSVLLG